MLALQKLVGATLLSWSAGLSAAPPLDFELAGDSGFVRLSALPPQLTLLNFWRSDCPPCVREMPLLAALAAQGRTRVMAVAVQRPSETRSAPDSVLSALKPPVLLLHAPSNPAGLLARFGNPQQALPYTVVLDTARQPCASKRGEVDQAWLQQAARQCTAKGQGG